MEGLADRGYRLTDRPVLPGSCPYSGFWTVAAADYRPIYTTYHFTIRATRASGRNWQW